MFSKLFLFAILLVSVVADLYVRLDAGANETMIGVYFPGDKDPEHDVFNNTIIEHYIRGFPGNTTIRESVNFKTGLVLRSADMLTRMRIDFGKNPNATDTHRPFAISFYNLAYGDRGGDKPIELQHGASGYVWIDGGSAVKHATAPDHKFTVRNSQKSIFFSVTLEEKKDEL